MDLDLKAAASLIGPNATLLLHDVAGHTILDVSGRLWITQEGDAQDIFLEAGEHFTVGRRGDTVLQALGGRAAVILLDPPAVRTNEAESGRADSLAAAIDAHAARLAGQRDGYAGATAQRPSLERIARDARRLRAAALDHVAQTLTSPFERGWRRLRARFEWSITEQRCRDATPDEGASARRPDATSFTPAKGAPHG